MPDDDPAQPVEMDETPDASAARWGPLRDGASILLNAVIALLGPQPVEFDLAGALHPRTPLSIYLTEVLVGFVVACALGFVIYRKWAPAAARWIWVGGLCGFAWRLANTDAFNTPYALVYWLRLDMFSAQTIGYSVGALLSQLMPLGFGALIAARSRQDQVEDDGQPDFGPEEQAPAGRDGGPGAHA